MNNLRETDNPYTLRFSFIPPRMIERTVIIEEIISNFVRETPTYSGMFITGVRGCGKTVMLSDIRKRIGMANEWITVDLNPEDNLLDSLARSLYLKPELRALFIDAKLDFSILGIGIHIEDAKLIASSEEDALVMMLRLLKAKGKKVFVTIDEITYSKNVARFSHALSSYSSEGYDIFVLMTGLLENIRNIRNKRSLTFLYRAKLKELDRLNITAIQKDYRETLGIDKAMAEEIAYETRGYSLAFQAVGYLFWNEVCRCTSFQEINKEKVYDELDAILSELAYEKIWSELSQTDRKILKALVRLIDESNDPSIKVEDIRKYMGMTSDVFTKYRSRLIDSGIVDGSQYGYLSFKLPRFENYILNIINQPHRLSHEDR